MSQIKAALFHSLHNQNKIMLLPNAWDALSARLFEQAGAQAIGTTSVGIAASLGFPDGQKLPKELFLSIVNQIVRAVNIPVTVDVEAGYGDDLLDIADTVHSIIDMGGVGINIEDSVPGSSDQLETITAQCKKISVIKALAEKQNCALFINARTDVFWLKHLQPEQRYEACLQRLLAYQDSGASGLFIPGLNDLSEISRLVHEVDLPVNILGGCWIQSMTDIADAGVARVSVGSAPCRAAVGFIQTMARKLMQQDDFSIFEDTPSYEWLSKLFRQ